MDLGAGCQHVILTGETCRTSCDLTLIAACIAYPNRQVSINRMHQKSRLNHRPVLGGTAAAHMARNTSKYLLNASIPLSERR